VVDYIADSTAVRWSAPHLTTFITLLLQTKVKVLHLIGHSMGTQALLDTISQLADVRVREVVLAAADIDRRIFEEQIAPALAGFSCRTTIYASAADEALRLSTTLNHGYERLGDCRDAVCVVPGVDSIDVSGVAKGILKHSTVFDVRTMVEDLHRLLQSSPIESRGLWERRNASGRYWVVPP
jgi:esterase/lipase superfamily enzyme